MTQTGFQSSNLIEDLHLLQKKKKVKINSPLKDQVEPVSNHGHPDELNAYRGSQVEPEREEDEEGVPEVSSPGHPQEQTLGVLVVGLQVVGGAHPKTLQGIHDSIHL